jgi:iron complex outermembrane recepter protein
MKTIRHRSSDWPHIRSTCAKARLTGLLLSVFAVTSSWSVAAGGEDLLEKTISVDIPTHSNLEDALIEVGTKAGVSVMINSTVIANQLSEGIRGTYKAREILTRVLRNTGLSYKAEGERVLIVPAGPFVHSALRDSPQVSATTARDDSSHSDSVDSASPKAAQPGLEQVVVTAQKIQQRAQDVPISISVLSGTDLDSSRTDSVSAALEAVPGVATVTTGLGSGIQLTVRGVTANAPLFSGASPIGYYIDSVPFGLVRTAIAPDPTTYDLNRIEVLRGPQGTLYGANALAGVVRVITNDPDLANFDFKGRTTGSTTDGGGANYRGDMAVNIPIIDGILAVRAVAGVSQLSGWIDKPVQANANDETLRNARIKIKVQPIESFDVVISAASSQASFGAANTADDNNNYPSLLPEPQSTHYNAYGVDMQYRSDLFTISSASTYLTYVDNSVLDVGPGSVPPTPELLTRIPSRVYAEEINLTSALQGPWRWSAGVFYRDAKDSDYQSLPVILPDPVGFTDTSRSWAVFGELAQRFFDNKLEWLLGVRYFDDRVGTRQDILFGEPPGTPFSREDDTFHKVTPRAVLSWFPNSNLTAYASYSQGFRSGFAQDELITVIANYPPVKPDKLSNYELGLKGAFLDRRLTLDAAVFYMKWDDIQEVLGIPLGNGTVTAGATVNGTSASGEGLEFSLVATPVSNIELGSTFAWNNLEQDNAVYSYGTILFNKGDRLAQSPEYTASAFAHYTFPTFQDGLKGEFSLSGQYTSPNLQFVQPTTGPTLAINGNSMIDGRTSLSLISQHWTTTLFADNVTNWRGAVLRTNVAISGLRDRPRTVGLQIEYHYR